MFTYIVTVAAVAVIVCILLTVCSRKAEGVVYTGLDKAGRITNIVLIPVYAALSLSCMGLGMFCDPEYEAGFLWFLGWIVSLIIPAAPLFCGLGIGLSVVLRKKGKRKGSFMIQFLGLAGIVLSLVLFFTCYGNLLRYID